MNVWCWVGIGVGVFIFLAIVTKGKIFEVFGDILDALT